MPDEVKEGEFKFDANTILFFMYLMYKCNMFTNRHLKHMLKIIKEPVPVDIPKYLVEEVNKAT